MPAPKTPTIICLKLINGILQLYLLLWRQVIHGDIHDIMKIGHLDQLDGPTGRAKKCVDAKSTPRAKHTASQTKLA
jgi:hypothetical protein